MAVRELRRSPPMLPMFARAGVAMIPGASRLPFLGGRGGGDSARDIPDLTLVLNDVAADRDRVASYDRVCGFDVRDRLPATYLHMLAFPLHLALMTDGSFPFAAIGLVHIHNRLVQHRPVTVTERVSLKVWATALQPHPRGRQFSICSEARVGDELVWEEVSTNLRRGSGPESGVGSGSGSRSGGEAGGEVAGEVELASAAELPAVATWRLPGDLGRRYGSVSGDLNPIHVHPMTARWFGFSSAIAHGMWTKARCLAELDASLPDAFAVEVAFRKPILLPATVEFARGADSGGAVSFGVRDASKGTPHLDGRVVPG